MGGAAGRERVPEPLEAEPGAAADASVQPEAEPGDRSGATNAPLEPLPQPAIPAPVAEIMATLWQGGQSAYVVGGCLRDLLLGREPADWDLTTDARPERVQALFSRSIYENSFGTVVVRHDGAQYEITAFRRDSTYTDFRHPDAVEFGDSIGQDLARRDFTVNAMAWGAGPGEEPKFVDPHGGRADLARRLLRAVGDPNVRFREDALRMVRAVRLAATLAFDVEADTLTAIGRNAALANHLSGERICAELLKLLAAPRPSVGLRLMDDCGLIAVVAPDLARQPGIGQNKIEGEDLWDHTLRTVDAAENREPLRLAALLHDIGKPDTLADGHFHNHEVAGATLTRKYLDRLHAPRVLQEQTAHLVRHHMFAYDSGWSDAAVRRFIRRVGPGCIEDLLALRAADNQGSGQPADTGRLAELAARIQAELAANVVLGREQLAIDGNDLMAEFGLPAGRLLGSVLEELTERVISEPALNERATLLEIAREAISSRQLVENQSL
jgi:putative nucleotidyltransferase with HDIG domain